MLRKIFGGALSRNYPTFKNLDLQEIPPQLFNQYQNPIFWTPRYQKIPYSTELTKYLKYLQRKKTMTQEDFRQMVENILS